MGILPLRKETREDVDAEIFDGNGRFCVERKRRRTFHAVLVAAREHGFTGKRALQDVFIVIVVVFAGVCMAKVVSIHTLQLGNGRHVGVASVRNDVDRKLRRDDERPLALVVRHVLGAFAPTENVEALFIAPFSIIAKGDTPASSVRVAMPGNKLVMNVPRRPIHVRSFSRHLECIV
jgi:hypothetical protein